MTYEQLYILLMNDSDNPFSSIRVASFFSISSLITDLINMVLIFIGKGLAKLLDVFQEFANQAYNFLSFGYSDTFNELYGVINNYIFIPLVICFIILALKLTTGSLYRGETKTILKNLGILFLVIAVLPSVFYTINTQIIGKDFLNEVQDTPSSGSNVDIIAADLTDGKLDLPSDIDAVQKKEFMKISNIILRDNTWDYEYLYNNSSLKTIFGEGDGKKLDNWKDKKCNTTLEAVRKSVNDAQAKYYASSYSSSVMFSTFDPNTKLSSSENFFLVKVSKSSASGSYKETLDAGLTIPIVNFTIGDEHYNRYSVDYINLYIQLIAVAIMFFCIGYSVIKLIIELLVHRLFAGIIAASDLTGGQRIKKFLTSIIGIYIALLLSSITVILFLAARRYVMYDSNIGGSRLVKSIITIVLAITMLDIPNIVARYFNINTGIRGGMGIAGMGLMAATRAATRAASRGMRSATQKVSNTAQGAASRARGAAQEAGAQQQAMENSFNRGTANQTQNLPRMESSAGSAAAAEEAARNRPDIRSEAENDYRSKFGSDGNYEKYEQPLDYQTSNSENSESVGQENPYAELDKATNNRDAIVQRAGAASAFMDYSDKSESFDEKMQSAQNATHATSQDMESATKANPAEINDAKQGIYSGIAKRAEAAGGKPADYQREAEKAATAFGYGDTGKSKTGTSSGTDNTKTGTAGSNISSAEKSKGSASSTVGSNRESVNTTNKGFQNYLADASYNAKHSAQIRNEAINIQSMNSGMSDKDAYMKAMDRVSGQYHFREEFKEKIAVSELQNNGSLRQGSRYSRRPSDYKVKGKSAL